MRHLRIRPPLRRTTARRCSSSAGRMEGIAGHRPHAARPRPATCSWATSSPARSLELGPDTDGPGGGHDRDVGPDHAHGDGHQDLAYTNLFPCGYSERMLLSAPLAARGAQRPRPPPRRADRADGGRPARRQQVRASPTATAPSCSAAGPVGLAVIAALRLRGVEPIVASDFSPARRAPGRRRWAPTRSSTRRTSRRSRPGGRSAAADRSSCSRPSACPG